jgi:protein tyrosine/serine phosphatase
MQVSKHMKIEKSRKDHKRFEMESLEKQSSRFSHALTSNGGKTTKASKASMYRQTAFKVIKKKRNSKAPPKIQKQLRD